MTTAFSALSSLAATKVAWKGAQRASLRILAESLHLDGTTYAEHPKETLAAWAKKHVKDGLVNVYQRSVVTSQRLKRSASCSLHPLLPARPLLPVACMRRPFPEPLPVWTALSD